MDYVSGLYPVVEKGLAVPGLQWMVYDSRIELVKGMGFCTTDGKVYAWYILDTITEHMGDSIIVTVPD